MTLPKLTVVVAVQARTSATNDVPVGLFENVPQGVEIIVCVAGGPDVFELALAKPHRVLYRSPSALVPHLWRDGLIAAGGEKVALTTSQFVPPVSWIPAILNLDLEHWVGVGGPIVTSLELDPVRWAVYGLRYWKFAPPMASADIAEIAADNAVYRRADVLRHGELLRDGFWEPTFHERFRQEGLRLCINTALVNEFRGGEDPSAFCRHRFQHGRTYGRTRGETLNRLRRIAFMIATPLLPFLLFGRVLTSLLRRPGFRKPVIHSLGWLFLFSLAWSVGEGRGYADALRPSPAA